MLHFWVTAVPRVCGGISCGWCLFSMDRFARYRILGWQIFFFQHLCCHFIIFWLHSIGQKVCCRSFICVPICDGLLLRYSLYHRISAICLLICLSRHSLCVCVFVYVLFLLLRIYWVSWICWFRVFVKFRNVFDHYFLKYSCLTLSEIPTISVLYPLILFYRLLRLWVFSQLFFSVASFEIYSTAISVNSLICFRKTYGQTHLYRVGE